MEDGGERRQARGGRDKVGWLGKVTEEDQKIPGSDPGVLANIG